MDTDTSMDTYASLQQIPDTRPYPEVAAKNELLLYVRQITAANTNAQVVLAENQLKHRMHQMIQSNAYLGLSVALSMAADKTEYDILWRIMSDVLTAKQNEVQYLVWPIVLVLGAKKNTELSLNVPIQGLQDILSPLNDPMLSHTQFLPFLLTAEAISQIKVNDWFQAKTSMEAAEAFAQHQIQIDQTTLNVSEGQDVVVLYALSYSDAQGNINQSALKGETSLKLMQVWQEALTKEGVTLFVNPMLPNVPTLATIEGSQMRQRMALDVFIGNALRSIRLQSPRVGVVIATQEGGVLLFSFQSYDGSKSLMPLVFAWHLSPLDELELILQNTLDLLLDCQVEYVRIMTEPLFERETIPDFVTALSRPGFNPFLDRAINA